MHLSLRPDREGIWPALVGLLAVVAFLIALPPDWLPGPGWVIPVLVCALAITSATTHGLRRLTLTRNLNYAALILITAALLFALSGLIATLPSHKEPAVKLLRSAGALWMSNVLVFALWYWKLDAGGPYARASRERHESGAFLFPQMSMESQQNWTPYFIDYVFLAFNTSTAFSPTDVAPLSRWAKVLMMIQSMISLTTLAVLAGRAINIL